MPYEPVVPDGQHLGTSHDVDDAVTGHLFDNDTNKLMGHAAWRWVDGPDDDQSSNYEPDDDYSSNYEYEPPRQLTQEELERAAELAVLILIGVVKAVELATPHVKRWWNETAIPSVKTAWKHVTAPRKVNDQSVVAPHPPASRPIFVASSSGVAVAVTVADSKISMNRAEWEHRFRAMLAAGVFKEEQLRILSNARIDEVDSALEAQGPNEELTPQQFANRILLMLEANPSLLEEETSAELMRVFAARSTQASHLDREI